MAVPENISQVIFKRELAVMQNDPDFQAEAKNHAQRFIAEDGYCVQDALEKGALMAWIPRFHQFYERVKAKIAEAEERGQDADIEYLTPGSATIH